MIKFGIVGMLVLVSPFRVYSLALRKVKIVVLVGALLAVTVTRSVIAPPSSSTGMTS